MSRIVTASESDRSRHLPACSRSAFAGSAMADTARGRRRIPPPAKQVKQTALKPPKNARIHHVIKEGDLTHQQAYQLHSQDHQIRQEERDYGKPETAATSPRLEQQTLNQQENQREPGDRPLAPLPDFWIAIVRGRPDRRPSARLPPRPLVAA